MLKLESLFYSLNFHAISLRLGRKLYAIELVMLKNSTMNLENYRSRTRKGGRNGIMSNYRERREMENSTEERHRKVK